MPVVGPWVTAWMPVYVVSGWVTAWIPVVGARVTVWNPITIQSQLLGDKGLDQRLSQRQQIPIPLPIGLPLWASFLVVDVCVMLVHNHLNPKVRSHPCSIVSFSASHQSI